MSNFIPGKEVSKVELKNGEIITIRFPIWQDLTFLLEYINRLSIEDTFVGVSGEQFSIQDETQFLASKFIEMELQNGVTIFAMHGNKIVGIAGVSRNVENRNRSSHRGVFGISVASEYRGLGLGKILATQVIGESKINIPNLKLIELEVFKINQVAVNLYRRLGFKSIGEIENGYYYKGGYQNSLKMILEI